MPSEPDVNHPEAVHIVFKLPSGQRLERRFLKSHSLEVTRITKKSFHYINVVFF